MDFQKTVARYSIIKAPGTSKMFIFQSLELQCSRQKKNWCKCLRHGLPENGWRGKRKGHATSCGMAMPLSLFPTASLHDNSYRAASWLLTCIQEVPTIFTDILRCPPQPLQASHGTVSKIRPRPLPSPFFPIRSRLISGRARFESRSGHRLS
jgi:hypothetical protein